MKNALLVLKLIWFTTGKIMFRPFQNQGYDHAWDHNQLKITWIKSELTENYDFLHTGREEANCYLITGPFGRAMYSFFSSCPMRWMTKHVNYFHSCTTLPTLRVRTVRDVFFFANGILSTFSCVATAIIISITAARNKAEDSLGLPPVPGGLRLDQYW